MTSLLAIKYWGHLKSHVLSKKCRPAFVLCRAWKNDSRNKFPLERRHSANFKHLFEIKQYILIRPAENIWLLRNQSWGHLTWKNSPPLTLPAPEQVLPPLLWYFNVLLTCNSYFCALQICLKISPATSITLPDRGHLFHLSDSVKFHHSLKLNAPLLLQKWILPLKSLTVILVAFTKWTESPKL